jgi:hypothetical protein
MTPGDSLREAALGRLAAQWTGLGGQLDAPAETAVVDLEALLGATARLAPKEPRIAEVALAWSIRHGSAINGARLRKVAAELGVAAELATLAAAVRNAGGPPWPTPRPGEDEGGARPWDAIDPRPGLVVVRDLAAPARLVWRLRAGFGVNGRADILAVLLSASAPLSIADLAARTRFGKRAVAGAVADMALAGLLEVERAGNADRVRLSELAPVRAWQPAPIGAARDEASLWRCVLVALDLHDRIDGSPDTVRAVEGRAAVEALRPALSAARLPTPDTTVLGMAFASEIDRWIEMLAAAVAP